MHHIHGVTAGAGAAPATAGRLIRWARWYDPLMAVLTLGQSRTLRHRTVELAGIRPGDRVLDVGCGTGDLTLLAAARAGAAGEVVGIDAAPEMIEVSRSKGARAGAGVRFEVGLIERLPFPQDYFDVALSSLMLHHLPGPLKQEGLAEVLRVLKPGGRLIVVDMQGNPAGIARALMTATGHRAQLSESNDVSALLRGTGFTVKAAGRLAAGMLAYTVGTKGESARL